MNLYEEFVRTREVLSDQTEIKFRTIGAVTTYDTQEKERVELVLTELD